MPIYKIPGEKKDGYQKYRVVVNYTDGSGKKKTVERRVYGRGAALDVEDALLNQIENKTLAPARTPAEAPLTVDGLWSLYKKRRGTELRQATIAKKESIYNNHIKAYLENKPVKDLTKTDLTEWRTKILENTAIQTVMRNNAYKELRALLNFAVSENLIPANPIKGIPLFRDPLKVTPSETIRYYTKEEFQKYVGAAKEWAEKRDDLQGWGICVFFNLAYYTGMRKGEINALRWSDLDGNTVWVRRSITQKIKGVRITETPPKNESSVRRLQMPMQLVALLGEHRERQKRDKRWNEEYRVCGGPDVIPDTTLEKANQIFAETASLKKITIHEFRHSHASLLCNAGINIKEIARRLGHSNVEITWRTYAHLYPAEEERAIAILNTI